MNLVFLGRFSGLVSPDIGQRPRPRNVRTVSDLGKWLARIEPALGHALKDARIRIVVNQAIIHDPQYRIADGDEVAFLPPMSGG